CTAQPSVAAAPSHIASRHRTVPAVNGGPQKSSSAAPDGVGPRNQPATSSAGWPVSACQSIAAPCSEYGRGTTSALASGGRCRRANTVPQAAGTLAPGI